MSNSCGVAQSFPAKAIAKLRNSCCRQEETGFQRMLSSLKVSQQTLPKKVVREDIWTFSCKVGPTWLKALSYIEHITTHLSLSSFVIPRWSHLFDFCEAKADIHSGGCYGKSPLQMAAERDHLEVARLLVEAKADLNSTSRYGRSPLQIACERGHLKAPWWVLQRHEVFLTSNLSGL